MSLTFHLTKVFIEFLAYSIDLLIDTSDAGVQTFAEISNLPIDKIPQSLKCADRAVLKIFETFGQLLADSARLVVTRSSRRVAFCAK